jgi:hypothetical protein
MDRALLRVVTEALAALPSDAATLTHTWNAAAGMWHVEVRPTNPSAALFSVAFDGDDLLSFVVGNIWFEVFPVRSASDLDEVADIARAVFQGRIEESGFRREDAFGRILLEDGAVGVGRVHVPWPWRARPFKRRYEPYIGQIAGHA